MAVSVTDKAKNICLAQMNAAEAFMVALETLVNSSAEKSQSGIDLTQTSIETVLQSESSPLRHTSGSDFNNLMGSVSELKTWMDSNGHTGNFQKVRP
jgi:hypothetical protein